MQTNQDWIEAYKELCVLIKDTAIGVAEIQHIDLDYDQLNNEIQEYPIPEHSIFMDWNAEQIDSVGLKVQDIQMAIGITYAFKSIADTHAGSDNQVTALKFMEVLRKLHNLLQGRSGVHFSSLNRIGFVKAPAPPYYIAYKMTYRCIIRDYSSMDEYDDSKSLNDLNVVLNVDNGNPPSQQDNPPFFEVPL